MTMIGFIGLGIMGSRMAANLQKNDFELIVYNRSAEKGTALVQNGAQRAENVVAAAQASDLLVTMLSDPIAVKQTALGPTGFLDHLRSGAIWMDCSTVNPSFSREMAETAGRRNIRFLDAPVAGTKGPAQAGELVFLVGGDEDVVRDCAPYFSAMGRKVIHVGGPGMGSSMKMVFNMLLGSAMETFAEALGLGHALGIAEDKLLEVLIGSPVTAPFIGLKKDKISRGDFEADFPLKWMHKDLQLAAVSAYETATSLPVLNAVKEVYARAKQEDLGDLDFSAVYRWFRP
jgi:3-hydroxyisobutyrate dehydrogenase/glyoxylate/succinic semialdehyde reductase